MRRTITITLGLMLGMLLLASLAVPYSPPKEEIEKVDVTYHPKPPRHANGYMRIRVPLSADVGGTTEMVVWYTRVFRSDAPDKLWVRAWKGNFWPDRNNIKCSHGAQGHFAQGVWFMAKFWQPATGRNFNPRRQFAKCHEDAYWTTGKVYITSTLINFRAYSGKVLFRAVTIGAVNNWRDTWDSTNIGSLPR